MIINCYVDKLFENIFQESNSCFHEQHSWFFSSAKDHTFENFKCSFSFGALFFKIQKIFLWNSLKISMIF